MVVNKNPSLTLILQNIFSEKRTSFLNQRVQVQGIFFRYSVYNRGIQCSPAKNKQAVEATHTLSNLREQQCVLMIHYSGFSL